MVGGKSYKARSLNGVTGNADIVIHLLATFVGKLRNSGVDIDIFAHLEWAVKKHATPFNPVSSQCFLCLYEKYFILWEPQDATLNKRTEIFSVCRHKECWLLVKN